MSIGASSNLPVAPLATPASARSSSSSAPLGINSGYNGAVNPFAALTDDDREMLRRTTGYDIRPDGSCANPDGKEPPFTLAAQIGYDRIRGALQGDVTPSYLKDLWARGDKAKQPLPADLLDKLLNYVAHRPSETPRTIETHL